MRAKKDFHPLLYMWINIVSKSEEKAKVHNAFFVSVFNSKTRCSVCTQSIELEDGDQN